jgi:hypothetical protein
MVARFPRRRTSVDATFTGGYLEKQVTLTVWVLDDFKVCHVSLYLQSQNIATLRECQRYNHIITNYFELRVDATPGQFHASERSVAAKRNTERASYKHKADCWSSEPTA